MSLLEVTDMTHGSLLDQPMQISKLKTMALDLLGCAGAAIEKIPSNLFVAGLIGELMLVHGPTIPPEAQKILDHLGVTNVSIEGNKLTLSLRDSVEYASKGLPKLWLDKKVSAEIERTENRIEIKKIEGLMVDSGAYNPWAYVQSAVFEKRNGKCSAKVTAGRFGFSETRDIELPLEVFEKLTKVLKDYGTR